MTIIIRKLVKYFIISKGLWTLFAILCFLSLTSQVRIASWNIKDLGKSKSHNQIEFISEKLRNFDIVALQEIVAGYGGPQAVARMANNLNRKGAKWAYSISSATNSSPYSSERYAFLWKTTKVKLVGKPWLDQNFKQNIEREPFLIRFVYDDTEFTLVNFHAIPKTKQPEREIKYFKFFPDIYKGQNLIFLGDFNTNERNTVFNPLKKMGYMPALKNQKTSLRTKCFNSDCLASEFDNIFFNRKQFVKLNSGIIPFYKDFEAIKIARKVSDHVPVFVELKRAR